MQLTCKLHYRIHAFLLTELLAGNSFQSEVFVFTLVQQCKVFHLYLKGSFSSISPPPPPPFLRSCMYYAPYLDHLCLWQSHAVHFCGNYAKTYFDEYFGVIFFKKVPSLVDSRRYQFSRLGP